MQGTKTEISESSNPELERAIEAFSDDRFLDGRLLLRQPVKGHRIGTDALLLAAMTPSSGRVCDFGSGVGAVGLALVLRGAAEAVLVERNPTFADCARHNARACWQPERVRLVEVDVFDRKAILQQPLLSDQSFDAVATNPPFDQVLRGRHSPSVLKTAAHAMRGGGLEEWLQSAVRLLRDGGVLSLIHRADRLSDVLAAVPKRAGGLKIRPVLPRAKAAATRILVQATAGSRAGLILLPPLVLHDDEGHFTPEAEAVHTGRARVRMQPGPLIDLL